MNLKTLAALVWLAAMPAPAFAQSSFFSEVLEVRVTNLDVVVTDRSGRPVHGLTRDDFELYEQGQRKEISNFLEIQEGPEATLAQAAGETQGEAALDNRRRQIVVFIDDTALHPLRRNRVLQNLGQFLESAMRPGDQVMIAAWADSLKLVLEPTSDRSKIADAVKSLAGRTSRRISAEQETERFHRALVDLINIYATRSPPQKPPMTLGVHEARALAMLQEQGMRRRAGALKTVVASLRGAPGRKVAIFVTESFNSNPAEEPFRYLDAIREQFESDGAQPLQEMIEFEIPSLVSDVANAANSSGVTFYAIDASGQEGSSSVPDASQTVRIAPSGGPVHALTNPVLGAIAADTGGIALVGTTNYQLAFDTISNDLTSYYSLGFRSSGERQDALRGVEVKLKKKGYRLRTRRAVIEPSVSSEMSDAVAAHLFRDVTRNELGVKAVAGPRATTSGSDVAIIPLTITIPMEKLTLLPEGADLKGSFTLFAAFLRMDGQVSKVVQQPQSFRFPAASLPQRKEIKVKVDVTADIRTDGVSIGVMDEASRVTGFAAVKVQ